MSKLMTRVLAWVVVLAGASAFAQAPEAPEPKEFDVALTRSMAAGETYEITEKIGFERGMTTVAGLEERKEPKTGITIDLAATMSVTAVDPMGTASEFSLKVKKMTTGGRALVREGVDILVKRSKDGPTSFTLVAGAGLEPGEAKPALSDEALGGLQMIYPKLNSSKITDDNVYPSKGKRKVGDTWDADITNVTAQAAGDGVQIDPKRTFGSASLQRIIKNDAAITLVVVTQIDATISATASVPPGLKFLGGVMKASNRFILPADPKLVSSKQEMHETLELRAAGEKDGKPVIVTMNIVIDHSQSITPVTK